MKLNVRTKAPGGNGGLFQIGPAVVVSLAASITYQALSTNAAAAQLMFLRASSLDDLSAFRPQMVVYALARGGVGRDGRDAARVRRNAAAAAVRAGASSCGTRRRSKARSAR
jgi:hypothetical protein